MRTLIFLITFLTVIMTLALSSAADTGTPFAAWPLPGGKFAYITPNDEYKIHIIDSDGMPKGQYITEIGKDGLIMPCDLVGSPDGWLFVLDRMKAHVNVYDDKVDFQYSFGEKGTGPGQLKSPQALAIDAYGFIYVADNGNNRIEKFDDKGKFIASLTPEAGEGVGTEFKYITTMAATPDGKLAVGVDADDPVLRRKIFVYDRKGDLFATLEMSKWGGQGRFSHLFIDEDNTLYIVDSAGESGAYPGAIWHIDKDGNLIRKYEAYDSDFGRYYSPVDVIVRNGRRFIFCAERKCLVFSMDGGYLDSFGL